MSRITIETRKAGTSCRFHAGAGAKLRAKREAKQHVRQPERATCPRCGTIRVRPAFRDGAWQHYACGACGFGWGEMRPC